MDRFREGPDCRGGVAKISDGDTTTYVRDASGNVMAIYRNDTLIEQALYGSSRLGMMTASSKPGYRTLGGKKYELSNHLGNVLAVVTDNIHMDQDSTWSQLTYITDYYPFGLAMEGRTMQDSSYRYGFNGKENDSKGEWGGQNHYDYGFRIYNPGIGKFLSVDPLTKSYPMLTPYQFASNSPIDGIDLDGLERVHYSYGTEKLTTGEVVPVLNFLGVQKTRDVQVSTVLGIFGWNPTLHFPLDKEIIVHAAKENRSVVGYRFKNMTEAFEAASSGFEGINRFDPKKTIEAEEMWSNNAVGNFNALGTIGIVISGAGFQRGLNNLERNAGEVGGKFSKVPRASELRSWAKDQNYELLSNKNGIETWGIKGTDGWRLKIKQPSTTLGIDPGSKKFRYSARSKPGEYLDPTTGKTGTRSELGHLDLDPN